MTNPTDTKAKDEVLFNRATALKTLCDKAVVDVLQTLSFFDRNRAVAHIKSGILSKQDVLEKKFS